MKTSCMTPSAATLRHYYWFWSGQQISSAGSAVVSFVIIWWITITTGSAWYLAMASAASFGMMLLSQLVAGYIADYINRKYVIIIVDGLQAIATTVMVYLFYLDLQTITPILFLLAIRGFFDGFHRPAVGAIISSMVPKDQLQRVNSLSSLSRSLINLGSPPLAAFLLVAFREHLWVIISLDAITFVIAVVPLLAISIPSVEHNKNEALRQKLTEGYSFLRNSTGLMPLLLIFASFNFFITPVSVLTPLVLLSERGFATTEFFFSLTLMSSSIGTLFMSWLLSKMELPLAETKGIILGFSITLAGLFTMGWAILSLQVFWFIVGNTLVGLSLPVVNVFSSMIWQTRVPKELQGRVISVRMMVVMWALPIFTLVVGALAETIQVGMLFVTAGLLFASVIALIWRYTDFRQLSTPILDEIDISPLITVQTSQIKVSAAEN